MAGQDIEEEGGNEEQAAGGLPGFRCSGCEVSPETPECSVNKVRLLGDRSVSFKQMSQLTHSNVSTAEFLKTGQEIKVHFLHVDLYR